MLLLQEALRFEGEKSIRWYYTHLASLRTPTPLGGKHWCINNIHPLKVKGIVFRTRNSSNVTVFSFAQVVTKSVRKPCGKSVSSLHTATPLEGYFP